MHGLRALAIQKRASDQNVMLWLVPQQHELRGTIAPANLDVLVRAAEELAHELGVAPVPESRARHTIERILADEQVLELSRLGLITRDEAANLLLAHLHSDLYRDAILPSSWTDADRSHQMTVEGLFG